MKTMPAPAWRNEYTRDHAAHLVKRSCDAKLVRLAILVVTIGSFRLGADELRFPVNQDTVAHWSVAGERPQYATGTSLVIPRSSGIARRYAAPLLAVEFGSAPFFGRGAADSPAIEIGSAALAFVRRDDVGSLVLFTGKDASTARWLPLSIPLDRAGRSAKPISVIFGLALSSAMVAVNDEPALILPLAAPRLAASDVVLSSGASEPWIFQDLTVVTLSENQVTTIVGAAPTDPATGNANATAVPTEREASIIAELSQRFGSSLPFAAAAFGSADAPPSSPGSALEPNLPDIADQVRALQLRTELVEAIRQGSLSPADALARLLASPSPSGLNLDPDTERASAVLDVGRRLIAAGLPESAEHFFIEAEQILLRLVSRTPGQDARSRAMYLHRLGLVRANYLGKAELAAADFDEATRLQPDDDYLRHSHRSAVSELGALMKKPAERGN